MSENPSLQSQLLDPSVDDSAAIEILGQYYRQQTLSQTAALQSGKLDPHAFRKAHTATCETVLRATCDRIAREPVFSEVKLTLIALRHFAKHRLAPQSPWPLLALYDDSPGLGRKTNNHQTAQRMLERIIEWIDRVTLGSVALSWPFVIESIPVYSNRICHWQIWLDALALHATAVHGPILRSARLVAGVELLAHRFLVEANASLSPPFRTAVDLEYLSGYFSAGIDLLRRSVAPSIEPLAIRSEQAIDALISIDDVISLSDRHPSATASTGSNNRALPSSEPLWNFWLDPHASSDRDLETQTAEFSQAAKLWFETTFNTPLVESRLAETILMASASIGSDDVVERLSVFQSPQDALRMLQELSNDQTPGLSSRNCRYHFSRIAESLIGLIERTPSPDLTLRNIVAIGNSLGGKSVLWELFSGHTLLMELYTRLCGTSPYLVQILLSNPGMIDDLLDSLMLDGIPDLPGFQKALDSMCKGAQDIESVVLSFKNAMHLAIGVRDILGRESITEIHRALADVHEICIDSLAQEAYRTVAKTQPVPRHSDQSEVDYAVLVIGKLASREPNYHSDISMLILYDSPVANHGVFFQQVAQKLIQMANRVSRFGRAFELKAWQFLAGKSSGLAWTVDQLLASFESSAVQVEHRMNLYTARIIGGSKYSAISEAAIEKYLHAQEWSKQDSFDLVQWRRELEQTATEENIKRGSGGTLDVEVLAHIFYAKHLHTPRHPWLRGTVERLEALRKNGVLSPPMALELRDAYYFLRGVESGLRLMNTKLRHDLPKDPMDLSKLAHALQLPSPEELLGVCSHYRNSIRELAQRHYAQIRAQIIIEG